MRVEGHYHSSLDFVRSFLYQVFNDENGEAKDKLDNYLNKLTCSIYGFSWEDDEGIKVIFNLTEPYRFK